ncbi:MAG: hypothetical protein H3C36_08655 [Chitinophagaceae bacterium]|nr:hypothetical protein [Chitinophagaceae bacterium]MCZ2396492.1 hypothetical protein [Chitinophagales bacterium]
MKSLIQRIISLAIPVFIAACNTNPTETATPGTDDKDDGEMKVMIPAQACYTGIIGKDTIFLKTEKFPNVVTGILEYKFFEKDNSKGDLDGVMRGDTLIAEYSFSSEGVRSIRQVAFLLQGDVAIEGYGELEEKEGKMIFKNTHSLKFDKAVPLRKTTCY